MAHGIAFAMSSFLGTFLALGVVLRQIYHSSSRSRYLSALSIFTSPLLTTWTILLLTNLLFVVISSPASTFSIQSLTGKILNTGRPTSCSSGYTSAGISASRFGFGIGLPWFTSSCISLRERMDVAEAAMVSRIMEAAGSRRVF